MQASSFFAIFSIPAERDWYHTLFASVKESGTKAWNAPQYQWHMICCCCVAIAGCSSRRGLGRDPKVHPEGVRVETTRDRQGGKNRKQ